MTEWCACNTIIIISNSLTVRVVGAPQMTSQPASSIALCSPVPSGTWWTPCLSIPWCCLPNYCSVCLVFSPLSLCLARWFWPDLMNGKHDHTTAVCVSLRWSGLHVVRLLAGSLIKINNTLKMTLMPNIWNSTWVKKKLSFSHMVRLIQLCDLCRFTSGVLTSILSIHSHLLHQNSTLCSL